MAIFRQVRLQVLKISTIPLNFRGMEVLSFKFCTFGRQFPDKKKIFLPFSDNQNFRGMGVGVGMPPLGHNPNAVCGPRSARITYCISLLVAPQTDDAALLRTVAQKYNKQKRRHDMYAVVRLLAAEGRRCPR